MNACHIVGVRRSFCSFLIISYYKVIKEKLKRERSSEPKSDSLAAALVCEACVRGDAWGGVGWRGMAVEGVMVSRVGRQGLLGEHRRVRAGPVRGGRHVRGRRGGLRVPLPGGAHRRALRD